MLNPSIIAPVTSSEESTGPNSSLNQCSRITRDNCPSSERCDTYGCSGACAPRRFPITSLSLIEMRRQHIVDIAVHVAHIRALVMLEAGV